MDTTSPNSTPEPALRIIPTPPPYIVFDPRSTAPGLREAIAEGGSKIILETAAGFQFPLAARVLRTAGNEAVSAVENAIRAAGDGLTAPEVQQVSAILHALDVSIGAIGGRIINDAAAAAEQDTQDDTDRKIEQAVQEALGCVWDALAGVLGARVGNPLRWHPDAAALAAVMTDVARGWSEHTETHAGSSVSPVDMAALKRWAGEQA